MTLQNAHVEQIVFHPRGWPGDLLMLTAAVRDLHLAYPGRFRTDVDTSCPQIWDNNPYLTRVGRTQAHHYLNMGNPPYSHNEPHPDHLATRYHKRIFELLRISVPVTRKSPEVFLSPSEQDRGLQVSLGLRRPYWIVMAGGKYDVTTKWWNSAYYQRVVDEFDGQLDFVQCGADRDWHPKLRGVVDMVGKTDIRKLIRLVYHSDGVLCPVTFAMHLAAAVPTENGRRRACVVIAGGRETPSLIQYPNHTLLHLVGGLSCCEKKGCGCYVCQETHATQPTKPRCEKPLQVTPSLKLPLCMEMITPEKVVNAVRSYYLRDSPLCLTRAV